MKTEDLELTLREDGIERIASVAWDINERTENIGARRLHTIMERLLEQVSFEALIKPANSIAGECRRMSTHS